MRLRHCFGADLVVEHRTSQVHIYIYMFIVIRGFLAQEFARRPAPVGKLQESTFQRIKWVCVLRR